MTELTHRRRSIQRLALALLLAGACAAHGCRHAGRAPVAAADTPLTAEQRQLNVQSFDHVWATVRDKHWDPNLGGLDWNAIRDELRPRVESADTMREARAVMSDMIDRLGQSHFGIIPASVYRDVDVTASADADDQAVDSAAATATASTNGKPDKEPATPRSRGRDGTVGIDVRLIDSEAVVTRVEPGMPADEAGVKLGWKVAKVDGRSVTRMIERVSETFDDSMMSSGMIAMSAQAMLQADAGESVKVTFIDGDDRERTESLTLARRSGTPARLGNVPTMYVTFESHWLPGMSHSAEPARVGYIRFNAFFDPPMVMERFAAAMSEFRDADGIVLDLRGNPGGIGMMAAGIGGYFVDEFNLRLGTMQARTGSINFILNPRPEPFMGPLAVLVDGLSMSTAEILAGGLQDLGRARIFGEPTPGLALPSIIERLPNGDGFQYAFANYVSAGGEVLEGRGVIPDQVIPLDRDSLLQGRDPVIEAAVEWIESQKRN